MIDLLGLTSKELIADARSHLSKGAGVALDVYKAALLEGRFAPEEHGIAAAGAQAWRERYALRLLDVVRVAEDQDESGRWEPTLKAVLKTHDGLEIECVRIPMAHDNFTLCISSQVGCKMGCKFCETGLMGLLRDLEPWEIVAQVVVARAVLGWRIKNIVFMGMGEALDNADNVIAALRVLNDQRGLDYSQQRMTVCTVGDVDGLARLAELGWKRLNVAVSLNAGRDGLRSELMPVNRKRPIAELIEGLRRYMPRRNFVFAVNYCLMPGVNDTRDDAREVASFCRSLGRVLVNLIPYNPGSSPLTRAPEEDEIERFIGFLEEEDVPVRRRVTKGRAAMAACGQLGNVELRQAARAARARALSGHRPPESSSS